MNFSCANKTNILELPENMTPEKGQPARGNKQKEDFEMEKQDASKLLTGTIAKFIGLVGKRLPDDVTAKLKELSDNETMPMAKMIYQSMEKNQQVAE